MWILFRNYLMRKKLKKVSLILKHYKAVGLISDMKTPVKLLGNGEIKAKLQVEVNAFSQSAKEKIEAAGGSIKKI